MHCEDKAREKVSITHSLARDRKPADACDQASAAEVVECFRNESSLLGKLALLITGDQATADQSVANACEITLRGNTPFRDWLLEWAKVATITNAISQRAEAIRSYEPAYKDQRCTHVEHLWQDDTEERATTLNLLLQADSRELIAGLDPLCRVILVLRVAIRSSIQDCVLRLNVSRAAVLAANCLAMTRLHDLHLKSLEENHEVSTVRTAAGTAGPGGNLKLRRLRVPSVHNDWLD